jgi:hypothetical protein
LSLHKYSPEVCAVGTKDERLFRTSVTCDCKTFDAFAHKHLCKIAKFAMKAVTKSWAVAEILRPFVAGVVGGKPDTVPAKLNEVRRKASESAPKKAGKSASAEPVAGRLNATYQRSALPAPKSPEQWSAGKHRALAAAGVAAFAREVHTEPAERPHARPKAKTKS